MFASFRAAQVTRGKCSRGSTAAERLWRRSNHFNRTYLMRRKTTRGDQRYAAIDKLQLQVRESAICVNEDRRAA